MRTKEVKSITIDPNIWEQMKRLARIDRRTASSMAELIIERYVYQHSVIDSKEVNHGEN